MDEQKQEIERLTQEIATLQTEKVNLVGELKEDRIKRQEKDDAIAELQNALKEATEAAARKGDAPDVAAVVKTVLAEELSTREASKAKSNQVAAIERFVNEHKEFHQDNDPTGKKREALETAVKRFNTNGLVEVEDFISVIADAARLLGVDTAPKVPGENEVPNPYSSTNRTSITPKLADDTDLTAAEKKLIEQNGWTKERFMKLKGKMPSFIESLVG